MGELNLTDRGPLSQKTVELEKMLSCDEREEQQQQQSALKNQRGRRALNECSLMWTLQQRLVSSEQRQFLLLKRVVNESFR